MGLFDSSTSTSTTTQNAKYNPSQLAILEKLLGSASTGLTTGAEKYSGDMYAAQNDAETSFLSGNSANSQTLQTALEKAISGNAAYKVDDETTKEYWDKYISPEVADQQKALNEQYASGIFSGGRDIAQGKFNTGVLGEYAKLQYADEEARRAALTDAANRQANTINTAWSNNKTYEKDAASLATDITERKLAGDYQRWMSGEADASGNINQSANPYRALALNLLNTSPYVYGSNVESTGSGLGTSLLSGLGSSAGSVLSSLLGSSGTSTGSGLGSILSKLLGGSSSSGFDLSDSELASLLEGGSSSALDAIGIDYSDYYNGIGDELADTSELFW